MLTKPKNLACGLFKYSFNPAYDILSFKNGYQIEVELPGVKRDDITIDCLNDSLNINAVKKDVLGEDKKRTHSEREFGTISQTFNLPSNIETEKLEAVLSDGVLTVTLPKKESSKVEVKIK